MKVVCMGVRAKAGTYEGTPYDNVILQCLRDDGEGTGLACEPVKFKTANIHSVMGKDMTPKDWAALEGKTLQVYYGKNNKVDEISVLDDAESLGQFFTHL